jgi:NAD-dependent deacetylase
LIRPGVVWFGEMLPEQVLHKVWEATRHCELFLVVGTSGVVLPAAALPELARSHGATVVEVNAERSELTRRVHHFLQGRAGEILPALVEAMGSHADQQPA